MSGGRGHRFAACALIVGAVVAGCGGGSPHTQGTADRSSGPRLSRNPANRAAYLEGFLLGNAKVPGRGNVMVGAKCIPYPHDLFVCAARVLLADHNETSLTYTAYFPASASKPSIALGPDPASCRPDPGFCVRWARGAEGDGHDLATKGAQQPSPTAPAPVTPTPTTTPGPINKRPRHVKTPGFIQSPSGNIECQLSPSPVLCTVESLAQQVTFTKDGKAAVSPQNSNGPLGARTLGYGKSARSRRVLCTSRTDGMRCVDTATGHGFLAARQDIKTF